jgi:hypothetical protein
VNITIKSELPLSNSHTTHVKLVPPRQAAKYRKVCDVACLKNKNTPNHVGNILINVKH